MELEAIRTVANQHGIKPGQFSITDLIKSIQTDEGDFDSPGTAIPHATECCSSWILQGEAAKKMGAMMYNSEEVCIDRYKHAEADCSFDELSRIEQLRVILNEYLDLYQCAPCGYHSLDKDGVFLRINDTELKWLGYTRDELIRKRSLADLLTPDTLPNFQRTFPQFKGTGDVRDVELELIRKDGTILPVIISATAIYGADGNYIKSRSTVYDMTERKKMEQERISYLKRQEEASHHLVAVQENERRRLSGELHDRTSPNLAAIDINLEIIATELPQEHSTDLAERLADTRALIVDTAASIREICTDLRPPLLDYAGLSAALEGYAQQFARRTGVGIQFDCANFNVRLAPDLESLLFRIFQEALTNCAKHARATSVKVTLDHGQGEFVLPINSKRIKRLNDFLDIHAQLAYKA